MSEQLLPCPFCGSAGMIIADDVLGPNELRYTPMCTSWILWRETRFTSHFSGPPECGAYVWGVFNTEAEAIAAWNHRAPAPAQGVPVIHTCVSCGAPIEGMERLTRHVGSEAHSWHPECYLVEFGRKPAIATMDVPVEVREALEWLLDNSQPLAVLEVTWTRQRGIVNSWLDNQQPQGQEATNE